tara:strand:+ start:100409 stop:101890 length:1482 start_codon:yes stop_codon:yes gene_type:complete
MSETTLAQIKPTNTIVFIADNHAYAAAGCYGDEAALTPAIDSIARRGKRFTNAYCASPLCCPSRAAIATGRFPHETGYFDNVLVYDGEVTSWMHRARAEGRRVVSVGKLHFRSGEDDNGFSEERIPMHILNKRGGTAMLLRAVEGELPAVGQWELYTEQSGIGSTVYQQYDRDITNNAITWLREQAASPSQQPWILFVSYASPHPPFLVPPHIDAQIKLEDITLPANYLPGQRSEHPSTVHLRHIMGTREIQDGDLLRRIRKAYYGLVAHVDNQIGEVLGELESLDLGDLRLIYTSDHGEMLGAQGLFGKSCVYEGAIKVPLVMCGPDIEPGTEEDRLVSHVDFFPTLLESVGVPLADADADLPGSSLLQDLPPDRPMFAEYHATGTTGGSFVLHQGKYKLILHVDYAPQLFDLENDPDEMKDLSGLPDHRDVLAAMIEHLKQICDPVTVDLAAKAAQSAKVEQFGGRKALIEEGALVFTPPPGKAAEVRKME